MIPGKRFLPLLLEDGALALRLRLLRLAGKFFVPSYRFKWPQLDWWKREEFIRCLDRFGELNELNADRKWMIYQLLLPDGGGFFIMNTSTGESAPLGELPD